MKKSQPPKSPKTPKTPSNQSSLFSYFTKVGTPSTSESLAKQSEKSTKQVSPNENIPLDRKRSVVELDDDSPPVTRTQSKRRRIVIESDDEVEAMETSPIKQESVTTPSKVEGTPKTPSSGRHRIILQEEDTSFEFRDDPSPPEKKKKSATPRTPAYSRKKVGTIVKSADEPSPSRPKAKASANESSPSRSKTPATPKTKASTSATPHTPGAVKEAYESFCVDAEMDPEVISHKTPKKKQKTEEFVDTERWPHETLTFLQPENIRDANKRRPDHPEYDPKTLYVPKEHMDSVTPGHKQWWKMKSQYFDTVIFFKVGKFYELYHMDALVGINNLDLTAMRGAYCHCGFPEIAYGKYSDMLLARGYKVCRVEQTETPESRDVRNKDTGSKDKVVKREICRITTSSTKTYGVYDGTDDKNFIHSVEASASYLMALVEEQISSKTSLYGLCFIDTTVGKFIFTQFEDDSCRSVLRTVAAQFQPSHVIFPKGLISSGTQAVFTSALSAVKKEALFNKKEFYPEDTVVTKLMNPEYLGDDLDKWPKELEKIFDMTLHVPRPLPNKNLCVRAFGGLMFYLNRCLIDVDMISMGLFEEYRPPNLSREENKPQIFGAERWKGKSLVLDGATLLNLHLVPPFTGKKAAAGLRDATALKFSLFNTIDSCKTAFGKRLLRSWICSPSCDPTVIAERQTAVEYLMQQNALQLTKKMDEYLKKLPDLEKLLQKINTLGLKYRSEKHPDSRAQMFFPDKYNKRKINDLITTLNGFERISKLATAYSKLDIEKCSLIERCIGQEFTDIREDLLHFEKAFDRDKAVTDGQIVPRRGIDKDYDASLKKVAACETACKDYVAKVQKELKISQITLFGTGKTRYLLEIVDSPKNLEKLGNEFELKSQKKGFKRYGTKALKALVSKLVEAENERDVISADATRKVFADFSSRKNKWNKVVSQIAILDCLASLAAYASKCSDLGFPMAKPEFDFESDTPHVEIRRGYHPLLISGNAKLAKTATKFIPNDTVFGKISDDSEEPLVILLTGPNMSGKTTLMRQVAVLTVLAQMGGLVPAESMKLTPADRIFSRIGAHDSSFAGQSTFYVELNETNSIIKNATKDSLVVIDELGRGTSTNDGTAIAGAVLRELADNLKCRTFFSTHYFALCDLVQDNPNVRLAHMNFIIENENDEDPTEEDIIVLYNLVNGACKRSYGFFCAKLAGFPNAIVKDASSAGKLLEEQQKKFKANQSKLIATQKHVQTLQELRELCSGKINVDDITKLIKVL